MSKENIDPKKANKSMIYLGLIAALFVIFLLTNGFGLFTSFEKKEIEPIPLEIGESHVFGNPSSPVTIYEFSDFSCSYCAAASGHNAQIEEGLKNGDPEWEPPIPGLKENYIDTGKVKFVWKYFPTYGAGLQAQRVSYCISDQEDKFWEYQDKVFQNQKNANNLEEMKKLAVEVGANIEQLDECLSSNKYEELLEQDVAMGYSVGVTGTPTFVVNGKKLEGAVSYKTMSQIIEAELSATAQ